jgi:tight adherence protein B
LWGEPAPATHGRKATEAGSHRLTSWSRLAVAAPWLVLLTMSFQRDLVSRYASPSGVVVLAVGALLCLTAYRIMRAIGRLPTERRVLG